MSATLSAWRPDSPIRKLALKSDSWKDKKEMISRQRCAFWKGVISYAELAEAYFNAAESVALQDGVLWGLRGYRLQKTALFLAYFVYWRDFDTLSAVD